MQYLAKNGGAMATAVALRALLSKVNIRFYPAIDLAHDSATYHTCHGPGPTSKTLRWAVNAFVPKLSGRTNPLVSKDEVLGMS